MNAGSCNGKWSFLRIWNGAEPQGGGDEQKRQGALSSRHARGGTSLN